MKDKQVEQRGILGQWKYSIEHQNDRYISLDICPKSQNAQN